MLRIDWMLDDELEPLHASSLLGRIVISDGVRSIDEPAIYVDSWFAALIRALESLNHTVTEIEIPEDPTPIVVRCDEQGHVHLGFHDREVIVNSVEEFRRVVTQRAHDFLDQARTIPGEPEDAQREIAAFFESS
jgi:hypothetical protein